MKKTKRLTIRLEPVVIDVLECKRDDLTLSSFMRAIVIDYLIRNNMLDPEELCNDLAAV